MPYGGNPSTNDTDAVKLLIGDLSTAASGELLSTAAVDYLLADRGSVKAAAVAGCEVLAAQFATKVGKAVGDLRIESQQKFTHYMELAQRLRRNLLISTATPYAGGVSWSDKVAEDGDTDRVVPFFQRGLDDNPDNPQTGGPLGSTTTVF